MRSGAMGPQGVPLDPLPALISIL